MATDQLRVNGNLYSWSSIATKVGGQALVGITAIEYSDSRERVLGYGQNRSHSPIGRSAGKYTPDPVKLTVWKHAADALRAQIQKLGTTNSFGNTEFTIVVQYTESTGVGITDILRRCVITKSSTKSEEAPDPLKEDLEIQCMAISWNGRTLYDDTEGT